VPKGATAVRMLCDQRPCDVDPGGNPLTIRLRASEQFYKDRHEPGVTEDNPRRLSNTVSSLRK
jgi:hypothetical protein